MNRFIAQMVFFLIRVVIAATIIGILVLLTQEFYIFPHLASQTLDRVRGARQVESVPAGVEQNFVQTADGKSIDVWYYPPPQPWDGMPVAIIFRGNSGPLKNFFPIQQLLSSKGIASYLFDYRGFGNSQGWPTQNGIYLDSESVLKFVLLRHPITARDVILFGWSIGTGPASHLALSSNPRVLVLLAPFVSLPILARETTSFDLLTPFMRHRYPNGKNLAELPNTCVAIAHGAADDVVPISHGHRLRDAFPWPEHLTFITSESGDHNNVVGVYGDEIANAIAQCPLS